MSNTGAVDLDEIERGIAAGVVADPTTAERCGGLQGIEFRNRRLGTIFDTVRQLAVNGRAADVDLAEIIGACAEDVPTEFVAELHDDPPLFWSPEEHAARIRLSFLEREIANVPANTREGLERRLEMFDELESVAESGHVGKLPGHVTVPLAAVSISGQQLSDLLSRPAPQPIVPGIWPRSHTTVLAAAPFTGKTTLALWVAMARVKCVDPFTGQDTGEPPARVLFYSIDETVEQVARRVAGLARFHPGGNDPHAYLERFTIIGIDPGISYERLAELRFTDEGLANCARFLDEAQEQGEPFTDLVVDAYTDMLPEGASDNDNSEATRILGELGAIAAQFGIGAIVLHHTGKLPKNAKDAENLTLRDYARGASAIVAKARVLFVLLPGAAGGTLEIHTMTNLARAPKPEAFLVSKDREPNSVEFFRPADPARMFPAHEYLEPGDAEGLSISKLAEALCGLGPGSRPNKHHLSKAHEVAGLWERAGLVTIEERKRGTYVAATDKIRPEAPTQPAVEPEEWWDA